MVALKGNRLVFREIVSFFGPSPCGWGGCLGKMVAVEVNRHLLWEIGCFCSWGRERELQRNLEVGPILGAAREGRELQGIFKCGGAAREGSFRESSSVKLQGKLRNLGRELLGIVWGAAEKF